MPYTSTIYIAVYSLRKRAKLWDSWCARKRGIIGPLLGDFRVDYLVGLDYLYQCSYRYRHFIFRFQVCS